MFFVHRALVPDILTDPQLILSQVVHFFAWSGTHGHGLLDLAVIRNNLRFTSAEVKRFFSSLQLDRIKLVIA